MKRKSGRRQPVRKTLAGGEKRSADVTHPKRLDRLEINPAEDGFIIYQPEKDRVHYLNHTAVVILELCAGRNSPAAIAETLRKAYSLSKRPQKEVNEILAQMKEEGLVR